MGCHRTDGRPVRQIPDSSNGVVPPCGSEQLVIRAEGEIRDATGALEFGDLVAGFRTPNSHELARAGSRDLSAVVTEPRNAEERAVVEATDLYVMGDVEHARESISPDHQQSRAVGAERDHLHVVAATDAAVMRETETEGKARRGAPDTGRPIRTS